MAKPRKTKVEREYIFTQKELKEKLGMEGDIAQMDLWAGLSPDKEERKVSRNTTEWRITTIEGETDA